MDKGYLIRLTNNLYQLTLLFPKKEPLRYKMRELADEILANSTQIKNLQIKNINNHSEKIEARPLSVLEDLEVLDSFFEVAKAQNWVSPSSLLAIQQEYSKIKESLDKMNREEPAFAKASADAKALSDKSASKKEVAGTERIEENEECEAVPQYPFFQDQEKINPVRSNPAKQEAIPPEAERTSNPVRNQRFLNGANGINERQRRILEILKEREKIQVQELREVFPQVTKRTLRRDFEQMFKRGLIERIGEKNDTYYKLKPFLSEEG